MLRTIRTVVFVLLLAQLAPFCDGRVYPCRWVFVSNSLRADKDVNEVERIVRTASEHGLNGMLLSAGLDNLDRQPPEYLGRLAKVKATCDKLGVEIIPCIFSIGYGWDVLTYNRNLAAGIPVNDAPFVVKAGEARLEASQSVRLVNGGFEEHDGDRLKGYGFHDKPGEVSFVDSTVFHGGKASLRFEGFGRFEHGHGRVMQQIEVQPHRCYRVSCWVKTESLEPANSFHVLVLGEDGRDLAPYIPDPVAPGQWRRIVMGFNSLDRDKVNIYAGVWEGKAGRLWIDDFEVQEVALLNVLRRPGTPVTVRSERTGEVCEEGKDYGPIRDDELNFRFDHEPPAIRVLPGGSIQEGERLKVSYYHGMGVNDGQVTACMSEPEVYEIWKKQAELIHRYLAPARYLLSMDEIRAGGSCQACKSRNLSMARILGDCVTKQVGILRQVNPKAEIFIWSDMLDPNHNAHGDYYLVDGDFAGSWEYVPKDLTIVCWYFDIRKESLSFFSSHGFKTLA
ncbi:MAG: carbohydrate binding domain-containing protein, partial [Phycisphaerales bacterium]